VKDEAVWALSQDKKGTRGRLTELLNEEARAEIAEWGK
jgi:hypothetical protein